jgi:molecular chaperone GrpE
LINEERLEKDMPDTPVPDAAPGALSEIEQLRKQLEEKTGEAARLLSNWQRERADFLNYQKVADRERAEIADRTACRVIGGVLSVVDDFDRALTTLPAAYQEDPWVKGLLMVRAQFDAYLKANDVCHIGSRGQAFDPRLHEAITQAEGEEGKVLDELRPGFMFKDTVLRPSLVVVGQGQKAEPPEKPRKTVKEPREAKKKESHENAQGG